jgi:signal transduction histidine kinase
MGPTQVQKLWLPYLTVAIGVILSITLAYLASLDTQKNNVLLNVFEVYFPWLILVIGTGISILLAAIIRVAQLAGQRAVTLDKMNENLKKEINDRIQAEEIKQKLEIALLQGQKLQAMGTLASGIAHDFNNLLYAIIGYIEMARDDVEKGTLVYKNLGKVLEASHRGQDLIARILAFSRRQHHHLDIIKLKSTIEAALSLLRPTIPASVIIHFNTSIDPLILANQTQLHQVLVNIINNAVDAMDGEGTIDISLSTIPATDPLLQQFPETRSRNKNYCKIDITDTGHGLDQPTMERIFEPFYTTKEVGKGTGLGLSIVHSIIQELQGEITVSSQLGHGTTFMILLPESI